MVLLAFLLALLASLLLVAFILAPLGSLVLLAFLLAFWAFLVPLAQFDSCILHIKSCLRIVLKTIQRPLIGLSVAFKKLFSGR